MGLGGKGSILMVRWYCYGSSSLVLLALSRLLWDDLARRRLPDASLSIRDFPASRTVS